MAVCNGDGVKRFIHDISNSQFRSKLEPDLQRLSGHMGIGVISDYEDQPLLIGSHLGTYAIVTVGRITNIEELTREAYKNATHFSEMSGDETNPTELVATLIGQEKTFEDGLLNVQEKIKGSCSILLLTDHGIYAARDRFGRTPVILGENKATGAVAVTMETAAFPNLDYEVLRELGPGEVVLINHDGIEQKCEPRKDMKICTFLWVYYGYPASMYEGHNVEQVRYRCGAKLAQADDVDADIVAGIPDSGTAHAIGYANHARIPYERPFVKYTPTWPRSFMPQDQSIRDLVARMKLIPVRSLIADKRLVFCEDSIVRGTQLRDIIQRVYDYGAKEIHMRPACPPLLFGCPYLNFSRSKSELDLAARRAVKELEGADDKNLDEYSDPSCDKHCAMIERIRGRMNLTTLRYQPLDDLLDAIGIPKENLCTYCWNGCK
jgi:amidophosphoribosyltransferase